MGGTGMKKRQTVVETEGLHYIGNMACELANMAREKGHRDLAMILDMAALEAKSGGEAAQNAKLE